MDVGKFGGTLSDTGGASQEAIKSYAPVYSSSLDAGLMNLLDDRKVGRCSHSNKAPLATYGRLDGANTGQYLPLRSANSSTAT